MLHFWGKNKKRIIVIIYYVGYTYQYKQQNFKYIL